MKKLFLLILVLVSMAGCATPRPKPAMPSDQAETAAGGLYAARYCVEHGQMPPETGAAGASIIHRWSDNFSSAGPLFAALRSLEKQHPSLADADCRRAAMNILEARARQDKANEDAAYRTQAMRELTQQLNDFGKDMPRTRITNCTRTVSGASCTTY